MVAAGVNRTYKDLTIDCATLTKTDKEVMHGTEVKRHVIVPRKADNTEDEYFKERTVRHDIGKNEIKYLLWWYSCGAIEHTRKPLHHVPQQFICRDRERQRREEQQNSYIRARI